MTQVETQTGSEAHEEPLRFLLQTAFGPMKEVEPDYLLSNRAGAKKGSHCKDETSDSDNEGDDHTDDESGAAAVTSSKKDKKVRVKVNNTGIERITETVGKNHAEQMSKSDTMLGFMGELVKMQKVKMLKELGVPNAQILKRVWY